MSDLELRALERRAISTGDPHDEGAFSNALRRAGFDVARGRFLARLTRAMTAYDASNRPRSQAHFVYRFSRLTTRLSRSYRFLWVMVVETDGYFCTREPYAALFFNGEIRKVLRGGYRRAGCLVRTIYSLNCLSGCGRHGTFGRRERHSGAYLSTCLEAPCPTW